MSVREPCFLTADEAARLFQEGNLTCEALVRSCLDRIADRDPIIKAWLHVDAAHALAQAREIDKRPPAGPIHGLAFGVKDVIDTHDLPTTQNSPLYQGHRPAKDAACVSVVRHSGAVILGKTDTVEFAGGGRKAATRNPLKSCAYARGNVVGISGGRRRFPSALRIRHTNFRLPYPTCLVQRHLRNETHVGRGQPRGREAVIRHAGHRRLVWTVSGRPCHGRRGVSAAGTFRRQAGYGQRNSG